MDSIDNCSGAQSGALDPINGMFWSWNTGYIFLKLEGIAEASNSPLSLFEYHIGGYSYPNNFVRNVYLQFKEPINFNHQESANLTIKANVLEILKTPNTIDFSKLSVISGVQNAKIVADNYLDMFSIINVADEK